MAVSKNRRNRLIKVWLDLAQYLKEEEIIIMFKDYSQYADDIIENIKEDIGQELEVISDAIKCCDWIFTSERPPEFYPETALIFLLIENKNDMSWIPNDFIAELRNYPKLAKYFEEDFRKKEGLTPVEIAGLFK